MSIFKRGKIYWFHFVFEGEHIQRSTKQGNPRVARQIEAAYRTQLAKGEVGIHEPRKPPSFIKAMNEFLEWSATEHRAHPGTYERHKASSLALLKFFSDTRLDKITCEDVEKFKSQRFNQKGKKTKRSLRPATVNRELACLKALFFYWMKSDVITKNPVSGVSFLDENNEQTRVISFNEQELYLAAAHQPLKDVATLMLQTGMRPEEIFRIRVEDIHIEESYLQVTHGKTRAARRKIPLNSAATEILIRRLQIIKGSYIFPGRTDKPVRDMVNAHHRAIAKSGVAHFRLYDLRHTWATRMAMTRIDLVTLAAMLGHSRIQMVLRYVHPTEQHMNEAMRRLEEFSINSQRGIQADKIN
jgi:integrase